MNLDFVASGTKKTFLIPMHFMSARLVNQNLRDYLAQVGYKTPESEIQLSQHRRKFK